MRRNVCAICLILCFMAGCGWNRASSALTYGTPMLPPGFPKRVAVAVFDGTLPANYDATTRFAAGLVNLGFDVASSQEVRRFIPGPLAGRSNTISEEKRKELHEILGIDGLFLGTLIEEKNEVVATVSLSVRMINVPTGSLIWQGAAQGDFPAMIRFVTTPAVIQVTDTALTALREDIASGVPKQKAVKRPAQKEKIAEKEKSGEDIQH